MNCIENKDCFVLLVKYNEENLPLLEVKNKISNFYSDDFWQDLIFDFSNNVNLNAAFFALLLRLYKENINIDKKIIFVINKKSKIKTLFDFLLIKDNFQIIYT